LTREIATIPYVTPRTNWGKRAKPDASKNNTSDTAAPTNPTALGTPRLPVTSRASTTFETHRSRKGREAKRFQDVPGFGAAKTKAKKRWIPANTRLALATPLSSQEVVLRKAGGDAKLAALSDATAVRNRCPSTHSCTAGNFVTRKSISLGRLKTAKRMSRPPKTRKVT
jgi:hypothetical protein